MDVSSVCTRTGAYSSPLRSTKSFVAFKTSPAEEVEIPGDAIRIALTNSSLIFVI